MNDYTEKDNLLEKFHIGSDKSGNNTEEFHLGGDKSGNNTEEFHLGGDNSDNNTEEFHFGSNVNEKTDDVEKRDSQEEKRDIDYTLSEDGNSITIDAETEAVDIVQNFIKEKLVSYGCEKRVMLQIRLAVEEIFVNIISYAYRPDVGKAEIYCKVKEEPMCVIIQFMDSGKPFDPLAYDEVDTTGTMFMERVGGFGIHLVKNTMDDVDYEFKNGKNILKIRKNL